MATTPTRRRARFGTYLRSLRLQAHQRENPPLPVQRRIEDAADFLEVSRQAVNRYELGQSLPRRKDAKSLATYYKATPEEINRLLILWTEAKQEPVRIQLPASTSPQLRSYLAGEAEAAKQYRIAMLTVPGPCQTFEYATAVAQSPTGFEISEAETERIVNARISRQGRLGGRDPMELHVVMDESVVHRLVGGQTVMYDQIDLLLQLADRPNVTLQVVPFTLGAYGTMSGDVTILEFPEEDPPAAYLEYPGGGRWVEEPADVSQLVTIFDKVAGAALTPTDTVALLRQRLEDLAQHDGK